ncbi:hypothetical protein [Chlamydia caviae]|uniref:Uncharacterized protein n=1 Tax=Chlamydia caviae (strain ATCC VR-813 / DSM 19441 / 03DC25 / GPIC) TaxID=227941 RepID=Q824L4_CHLCV|nr:hypothetical protein [Chlamydia caviae]AAP04883.1 conserved hypothetical protein [Chlamydia caviae GPIC]
MLIRLFFGIPLTKGLQVINYPPLTVAIFQKKEYLGIYSLAETELQVAKLNEYYHQAQEILQKVTQGKYLTDKETSLVIFPEILIGK